MDFIRKTKIEDDQACLWFLGQAGYLIRSCNFSIAIDPYLSDSVGHFIGKQYSRMIDPPIQPEDLQVDIFIVTHDHYDHLDPGTIEKYKYSKNTKFVAPRLACQKLKQLGISQNNIYRIDSGETKTVCNIEISGCYAVPSGIDVVDTCGYIVRFENGRSFYHSSDTAFSDLLTDSPPQAEVALLCINGKWGNMGIFDALKLAEAIKPKYAIPNHYDLMALNSENPETFKVLGDEKLTESKVVILDIMEPFIW